MTGDEFVVNMLVSYGVPLLLVIAWLVFVARRRDWRLSNRIVAAIVGSLVIMFLAGSVIYYAMASLIGVPAFPESDPRPPEQPIYRVIPAATPD